MGFEPTTSCLEGRRSAPELLPLSAIVTRPTAVFHAPSLLLGPAKVQAS